MESFAQSTNMKRFVIQDSFTKVTTDGEPHEMMTMIAGLSGLLAAIIILAILVSLIGCNKSKQQKQAAAARSLSMYSSEASQINADEIDSKRSSVLSILRRDSSTIEVNAQNEDIRPRLMSVSCISNGNLEGNLNSAFVGSELSLSGSLTKKNNRMVQEIIRDSVIVTAKDTIVNVERY